MTDRKVGIKATLDTTEVAKGFQGIKQQAADASSSVAASAKGAAQAVDKIGDGGQAAAAKVDSSTRSIIGSIQRTTAALEGGGKATRGYYEALAQQRGINVSALEPYLRQLDSAASKQTAVGVSAGQMQAALRGVPAQFTDIATSIASGQAPLTVLLQQGGQLKDMFGGIGPAARALAGYVAGLVNPLTIAAAAIGVLAVGYVKGAAESREFEKAVILSGNAAGVTAGQLGVMAANIGRVTNMQGAAAEALVLFTRTGVIGRENLEQFTLAAVRFADKAGVAVKDVAAAYEDLAKAPLEATIKLNQSYGYLTEATYKQIKALEEQGKKTEAARVAQEAFAGAQTQIADKISGSAGTIERAWDAVTKAIRGAGNALLSIGRDAGPEGRLEAQRATVAALEQRLAQRQSAGSAAGGIQSSLDAARAELSVLEQQVAARRKSADAEAATSAAMLARSEFDKQGLQYASDRAKMEREVAEARELGRKAGAAEIEIQRRIGEIRAKYADKRGGGGRVQDLAGEAARQDAQAYKQIVESLLGVQARYTDAADESTEAQKVLNKAMRDGVLSGLPKSMQDTIAQLLKQTDAMQRSSEAAKARDAVMREVATAEAKAAEDRAKTLENLDAEIARERERVAQIGLTKEAIEQRTLAQMDANIAAQEAALGDAQLRGESEALVKAYEDEISRLRELRRLRAQGYDAQGDVDRRDALAKLFKDASAESAKMSDDINRGLTDSLFRAAESGKGFFETLRDSLKGMFANLILRPMVSATVGTITGALGLTGTAAQAAQGASGGLGTIGSLASLGGALGSFGSGFASGLTAWGAGGSVTGLLSSGSSLFAGGIANGLGTIAGALGPIALGIGAVLAIVSMLGEGGGPKEGGSFSTTGERLFTPETGDAIARGVGETILAQTDALISRFGGSRAGSTVSIGFDRDPLGDAGTRIASRVIGADGRVLLDNSAGRSVDDGKLQEELAGEAQRVLLAALQASNLERGFGEIFGRLDPATAAPEAIANLLTLAESLYQLGEAALNLPGVMGRIAELSATAREQLVGFAGGMDALASATAAYYEQFYSEAERTAQAQSNLTRAFSALGIEFAAVDTREEFRALVEGIDLQTEAGRKLYAESLKLAGPLAQWIDAAAALSPAAQEAAAALDGLSVALDGLDTLRAAYDGLSGARGSIADEIRNQTVQGMIARGDSAGAVEFYRTLEADLWAQLGNAADKGAVAGQITQTFLERMQLEADVQRQVHEDRIEGLRDEITTLEDMAGVADQLRETISSLNTGALSALSPEAQLQVARADYEAAITAARGGDMDALRNLSGSATAFLAEARDFFASGGDYGSLFERVNADLGSVGASLSDLPARLTDARSLLDSLEQVQPDNSADTIAGLQRIDAAFGSGQTYIETTMGAQLLTLREIANASLRNDDSNKQILDRLAALEASFASIAADGALVASA